MTYLKNKKLTFMGIVNRIKGFVRSVSGIPPLILSDCVDENSLISYSISGNSIQNGTPTPDAPVEVESVGEYDEETGKYKIPVVCSDGQGNSVTKNIYLDEPLRKIGNYADYIDFENQKVVRYITHMVFDGSENWTYSNLNQQTERFVFKVKGVPNLALCNILPNNPNSWYSSEFCFHLDSNGSIRFYRPFYAGRIETTASLPNWKTFLADNFLQGSPIKAWYATENPVEQTIFLPKLPTFKGTTIYTIGTTIQPSDMSATYYATSKE